MTFWLGEVGFLLLVAVLSLKAPPPALPVGILFALLWLISWLPRMRRPVEPGRLRRDRALALICLGLLSIELPVVPAGAWETWWPAVVAFLLAACGLISLLDDRRRGGRWGGVRREMALAALVLLVASAAVAGVARAVLAFRSTRPIPPGSVDFLAVTATWLATWFGLDAAFRQVDRVTVHGADSLFWANRHALLLGMVAVVIFSKQL